MIKQYPPNPTESTTAKFVVAVSGAHLRLKCRLDQHAWKSCKSQVKYGYVTFADHRFSVRAVNRKGQPGSVARYWWSVVPPAPQPLPFDVRQDGLPEQLFPGAEPVPLPVTITNTKDEAIVVTGLWAEVAESPPGCDGAVNLSLQPSNASDSTPLFVMGNSSVRLPAQGVTPPTIQLLNLPFNQDACKGGSFTLAYGGSAHT